MAGSWDIYGYAPDGKDKPPVFVLEVEDGEYSSTIVRFTPAQFSEFLTAGMRVQGDWRLDIDGDLS